MLAFVKATFFTFLLASLGACAASPDPAVGEDDLAAALTAADDAAQRVDRLEARVAKLQSDLVSVKRSGASARRRYARFANRFGRALAGARTDIDVAIERAEAAALETGSLDRGLSVLEERFDYHLRRSHGGG